MTCVATLLRQHCWTPLKSTDVVQTSATCAVDAQPAAAGGPAVLSGCGIMQALTGGAAGLLCVCAYVSGGLAVIVWASALLCVCACQPSCMWLCLVPSSSRCGCQKAGRSHSSIPSVRALICNSIVCTLVVCHMCVIILCVCFAYAAHECVCTLHCQGWGHEEPQYCLQHMGVSFTNESGVRVAADSEVSWEGSNASCSRHLLAVTLDSHTQELTGCTLQGSHRL